MTHWLALSDGLGRALPAGPDLARGLMIFDIALPLTATTVLLDHAAGDAALSLIHDPAFGFGLLQRRGTHLVRHMLPGARATGNGTVQLLFTWDAGTAHWSLCLTDGPGSVTATGVGALPMPRALLAGACAQPRTRAPALLWFGLTPGGPVRPQPLIGPRTPIETPAGPVAAAALRPGDTVLTRDHGPCTIRALARHILPGTGSFAPIRLRAPFFGASGDLLVSPAQQVALSGIEVEYLFGEDEVLVEARHLADGTRALIEDRRTTLPWIAIDLGLAAFLVSGRCALVTAPPGASCDLRSIDQFEARALQAMRRKGAIRSAA